VQVFHSLYISVLSLEVWVPITRFNPATFVCQSQARVNRTSGVMVSMLTSSAVDRWFDPRSGQTKDYEIGICCFSAKHTALRSRRKRKDWLARNQDNVSEWGEMSINRVLFQ
jgi:hypothetical protein